MRLRPSSRCAAHQVRPFASARAVTATVVALGAMTSIIAGGSARAAMLASLVTDVGGVGILAPDASDPVIEESISRLRAELHLVGLESHVMDCDGEGALDARAFSDGRADTQDGDPAPPVPPAARNGVARANIALAREDGVETIEVIEKLVNGSKFFRLVYVPARDGGDDPAVLAVRGVELLRDLHMDVERNRAVLAAAPVAPAVVEPVRSPPTRSPGPWRVAATAGLLQGRNGLGPRVAPAVGVARNLGTRLSAALLASGPYFQDLTSAGSTDQTSTRQELALLSLRGALQLGPARPFAAVSAGVLHLVADGHSDDLTAVTHQQALWSVLASAGVGAAYPLTRFFELVAEADLLAGLPGGRITIRDSVVGTAGAPSALFQLGLWAALPQ